MTTLVQTFFAFLVSCFRSRAALQMENTMLRHQLNVYACRQAKPRLRPMDRFLWAWVSRIWPGWQGVLTFCKPATVIAWQRKCLRVYWAALSQKKGLGRPPVPKEFQDLIKQLSSANIGWGVPRIVGELRKLGIHVAKSTVEKYRVKHPKSPSPSWKSFLANHLTNLRSGRTVQHSMHAYKFSGWTGKGELFVKRGER